MMRGPVAVILLGLLGLALPGCGVEADAHNAQSAEASAAETTEVTGEETTVVEATAAVAAIRQPPTPTAVPTSSPLPTEMASATPLPTPRPSATPTPVTCDERLPAEEELLTIVTRQFGLSRDYVPGDLVPLEDYFPNSVTLGYPTEVRAVIIEPLQEIVAGMQEAGLAPQIISGFRSYSAQALALEKWLERYPDWARNLSAPPGHSEHHLGTTVDFGSPELEEMVGEEYIQFHPAFARSSEGVWLSKRAHEYGFTMSYPADAMERTEFYSEPWHFRYVGRELATTLKEQDLTISEYLLQRQPQPCIP